MKSRFSYEKYPEEVGFVNDIGAHTSRTIMFKELLLLLNATDQSTPLEEIQRKVYAENILHKKSISGREKTFRFLKKMYGLNQNLQIYNTFRWAWYISEDREHPLLAILCALSRDLSLRITAPFILSLPLGGIATKEDVIDLIEESFPNRFSPSVIDSMALNLLSSWKQSGHLHGLSKKTRTKAHSGPSSCVFALVIGYLAGYRGRMLLDTLWMRMLDATDNEINDYLRQAMKKGWIQYRQSGGMIDIEISHNIFRMEGKYE